VVQLPIRRGQEGTIKLCSIDLSLLISFDAVITERSDTWAANNEPREK
jgi:hypothetical protein